MDIDVVVIGAGLAGLAAANRVAEAGLRVVVLEAGEEDAYLCNSRIATGALNMAHTDPTDGPEAVRKAIDADTEGFADESLADALAQMAGAAVTWMQAQDIPMVRSPQTGRWVLAPPKPVSPGLGWQGRGPDIGLRRLGDNLVRRGGRIERGRRARRLLIEGDRCVGVHAESEARSADYRAPHTLLADGGFQGNPELVRRFISRKPEALVQRSAGTGRGDALLMAEAAGAALTDLTKFYGHVLVQEALHNSDLWPYPTIDTLASSSIVVDRAGQRFMDEGLGGIAMANVIAGLDDPLSATAIFDEAQWETAGSIEFVGPNPYLIEWGGSMSSARTLPELAEKIGIAPHALEATVIGYNKALDDGAVMDLDPPHTPGRCFGSARNAPDRIPLRPIRRPPFHAIRLCAGLSYTLGGIAIDTGARVLRPDGRIVPGLLAAGGCTGGIEGGPVAGYIGGYMKALCLGLIAGDTMIQAQRNRRS